MSIGSPATNYPETTESERLLDKACLLLKKLDEHRYLAEGVSKRLVPWFCQFKEEARNQHLSHPEYLNENLHDHREMAAHFERAFLDVYRDYRLVYWVDEVLRGPPSGTCGVALGMRLHDLPQTKEAFLNAERIGLSEILGHLSNAKEWARVPRYLDLFVTSLCRAYDLSKEHHTEESKLTDEAKKELLAQSRRSLAKVSEHEFECIVRDSKGQLPESGRFEKAWGPVIREIIQPQDRTCMFVLSPPMSERLFAHYKALTNPWIEAEKFERARLDAKRLENLADRSGKGAGWELSATWRALVDLGDFAREVRRLLIGEGSDVPAHRRDVGLLLQNLEVLGRMASHLLEAAIEWQLWKVPNSQVESASVQAQFLAPEPPLHYQGFDVPKARPASAAVPMPDESQLLREFRRIVDAAETNWYLPAKEHNWRDLQEQFKDLLAQLQEFQERLAMQGADSAGTIASQMSPQVIRSVHALDKMLPSRTRDGLSYLVRPEYAELEPFLRETRNQLFRFASAHGNYREYKIKPDEKVSQHQGNYEVHKQRTIDDQPTFEPIIKRVISPGYCLVNEQKPVVRAYVIVSG